uniref:Protein kinase domain-containing protein n=1 Tax=Plectus sambesii TaxID=2011161 RepID=A0A914VT76_9BILA
MSSFGESEGLSTTSPLDRSATSTNEKVTALRKRLSEFMKGLEEKGRQCEERLAAVAEQHELEIASAYNQSKTEPLVGTSNAISASELDDDGGNSVPDAWISCSSASATPIKSERSAAASTATSTPIQMASVSSFSSDSQQRRRSKSVDASAASQQLAKEKQSAPVPSASSGTPKEQRELMGPPAPPPPIRSSVSATNLTSVSDSLKIKPIYINSRQYAVLNMLGKGGSSKVYQVYDEEHQRCLAVKCVDLRDAELVVRRAYENEIKLLERLQKSNRVVRLFDYEKRGDDLFVLMEKGDTDFSTFLKGRRNELSDKLVSFYWAEMLQCVKVIHEAGIVHSDLKPCNFLLVGGNLKLIDFGIASAIPSNKTAVTKDSQMGTINYMSPETIKSTASSSQEARFKIPLKSDVWSLGCILYNMVYGRTPFQHIANTYSKMLAIVDPNTPIQFPPTPIANPQLINVMQLCLRRDPKQRPSVPELLEHPYLSKSRPTPPMTSFDSPGVDQEELLQLGKRLGENTPRTNARLLKRVLGQVQAGQHLDLDQM